MSDGKPSKMVVALDKAETSLARGTARGEKASETGFKKLKNRLMR